MLVYIMAGSPWGPVKFGLAASMGDLLGRISTAPAHIEDIGERDPDAVIAEAGRLLMVRDTTGLIHEPVGKAVRSLVEAKGAASAMW